MFDSPIYLEPTTAAKTFSIPKNYESELAEIDDHQHPLRIVFVAARRLRSKGGFRKSRGDRYSTGAPITVKIKPRPLDAQKSHRNTSRIENQFPRAESHRLKNVPRYYHMNCPGRRNAAAAATKLL